MIPTSKVTREVTKGKYGTEAGIPVAGTNEIVIRVKRQQVE